MATDKSLIKLVVFGSGGVGKSALTVNFVQHIFLDKYDPTIEDSYRKLTQVDNEQVMLEILDTAGTDQFTAMRDLYMRSGDGFMLVYSTVALSTFNDMPDLYDQVLRTTDSAFGSDVPMLLVGTKIDMADARMVTTDMGEALANKFQCSFIEVSAKTRINVDEAFLRLTRAVLAKRSGKDGVKKGKKAPKKSACAVL